MRTDIFNRLGDQLRRARHERGLTQPQLASRLGRNQARISELERDLRNNRLGRDRLTLFAEICDALDLVPVLVPRARANEVCALIAPSEPPRAGAPTRSAFDDVFVDLSDDEEEG
jgi:transcriptional regulator with XRE-family HTH domain